MATIKAFRALRYDQDLADQAIGALITQPYDVIDEAGQEAYYQAHPNNMIRLEWGKKFPTDSEEDNRYTRAAAFFQQWQQEGVLRQDARPAFYLYRQEFSVHGQSYRRSGFMATIKAEGYASGQVMPHEETLPKHKADRLQLMQATKANFSPIFGLYAEESRTVDQALAEQCAARPPAIDFSDEEGIHHQLWPIDDPATVALIEQRMADLRIYIADGHHRYETASLYAEQRAAAGLVGGDLLLIDLVNLYDPGLVVLPTHRLVKDFPGFNAGQFCAELEDAGFRLNQEASLEALLAAMAASAPEQAAFGLYLDGDFYCLRLNKEHPAIAVAMAEQPKAYRQLDVSIAHRLILEQLCGIGAAELAAEGFIGYTRVDAETVSRVDSGEYRFSLLLNPTKVEELLAVANAGAKMPQKSTYFYPKIIAGLAINSWD